MSDALHALLHARRGHQPAPTAAPGGSPRVPSAPTSSPVASRPRGPQAPPRTRGLGEAVQRRRGRGQSRRQIAQAPGMARRTVRQAWAADPPLGSPARRPRPTPLPPACGARAAPSAHGGHPARRLAREVVPRGAQGAAGRVRVGVRSWRPGQADRPPARPAAQRSRLPLQPAGRVTEAARDPRAACRPAKPRRAQGDELKRRVQPRRATPDRPALAPWRQAAETSALPAVAAVARRSRQAAEASPAAPTTPCSTGQGQGQLCRGTRLTRCGAGRATRTRLRPRMLPRRALPMTLGGRGRQSQPPVAASRQAPTSGA